MRRWRLLALAAAVVAVVALAVLLLRPTEREGFEDLLWHLRTFDTARAEILLGGYGTLVSPTHAVVARRDRKVGALDLRAEPEVRWLWDRGRSWTVRDGAAIPLAGTGERVEEAWEEARSGFADVAWRPLTPADLGQPDLPGRDLGWHGGELPFEWSRGWHLLLALTPRGDLRYVLVVEPGGESHLATVLDLTWNGPVAGRLLAP